MLSLLSFTFDPVKERKARKRGQVQPGEVRGDHSQMDGGENETDAARSERCFEQPTAALQPDYR